VIKHLLVSKVQAPYGWYVLIANVDPTEKLIHEEDSLYHGIGRLFRLRVTVPLRETWLGTCFWDP
jgi:hypothetical protein